ncbi:MAG: F0F1 ATP synthase subunit epsilon [Coxiellaceae bacterium]|jgi:F-type H+-transporting ATPase subunit epsilon|nr:F0F1 ATP synthase subunit epsilon [Coxiellaceae bacterium]
MKATVRLEIVSLEAEIFSGLAEMVVVTGIMGELGILPGHMPLLTAIQPGQIRITLQGGVQDIYYISGGLMEVQLDVITILADTVTRATDIDEAAAITARESAERLLANKTSNVDFTSALVQIAQATAKLRTIKLLHKNKSKSEK